MKTSDSDTTCVSLALLNGKVWTGCADRPQASAVAVATGHVVAVGADRDVKALVRAETKVIDLAGGRVLPGFRDSHVHFIAGGFLLRQVSLRDAAGEQQFGRRLAKFAEGLQAGEWILGGNWDEHLSLGGKLPDRVLLDRSVRDKPVFIRRYDGHVAACNSRALELAGIGAGTPDPPGGRIDRDATGRPTGILRDAALRLVAEAVPQPSRRQVAQAADDAIRQARRFGLTAIDDMGGGRPEITRLAIEVYQRLAAEGQLPIRVNVFLPLPMVDDQEALQSVLRLDGQHVRFGGFKAFYDGSLGARTALMFEPYLDAPETAGLCVTPREQLEPLVARADAAGHPVAVHAIGDRAVKEVLDIFEAVAERNGPRRRRFRIEHAQHVRPQDMPRFGALGVIASMQPYHAVDDARFAEACLGRERMAGAYAWRSLLDAGAEVIFGSDWPVSSLNPLLGIDAAVNREVARGQVGGEAPGQSISVVQAVRAYTVGAIEAGGPADMVVLSGDIFDPAERENIARTEVVTTIVGGVVC